MSKNYQSNIIVPGCKALFIDRFIPHTGTVKNIYQNVITFKDVTFLDRVLDYEYKDRVREEGVERNFEIAYNPNYVYRTDRFFLPKYPSILEQMQMNALMDSLKRDPETGLVNIHTFMNTYQPRSLYDKRIHDDNQYPSVKFMEDRTVIIFDDEITDAEITGKKLYRPVLISNGYVTGYALLEFTSKSPTYPSRLVITRWLNGERGVYPLPPIDDSLIFINNYMCSKLTVDEEFKIEIDTRFNEKHILRVLNYSPEVAYQNYQPGGNFADTELINTWRIYGNDLIIYNTLFYDEVYRKTNS